MRTISTSFYGNFATIFIQVQYFFSKTMIAMLCSVATIANCIPLKRLSPETVLGTETLDYDVSNGFMTLCPLTRVPTGD